MTNREEFILHRISSTIKSKDPNAEVILFGSHARGTAHAESDWDILILLNQLNFTKTTETEYRNRIYDVELEVGEAISTFVYSKQIWETKYAVTPFYQNIKKEGIILK
ncbi:MAG: nucleotidyltransferase domain-containing protein [Bacteroidota bacterium]